MHLTPYAAFPRNPAAVPILQFLEFVCSSAKRKAKKKERKNAIDARAKPIVIRKTHWQGTAPPPPQTPVLPYNAQFLGGNGVLEHLAEHIQMLCHLAPLENRPAFGRVLIGRDAQMV
jgi:hypothetical protein